MFLRKSLPYVEVAPRARSVCAFFDLITARDVLHRPDGGRTNVTAGKEMRGLEVTVALIPTKRSGSSHEPRAGGERGGSARTGYTLRHNAATSMSCEARSPDLADLAARPSRGGRRAAVTTYQPREGSRSCDPWSARAR